MKTFLSRHRFELMALAIAFTIAALHWWVDTSRAQVGASEQESALSALGRWIQVLEGRAMDLHFRVRGPRAPHPDVVIAVVDERSIQKHGLWPWPRSAIAGALRRLHEAGAAAIGMDMVFMDEDRGAATADYQAAIKALDGTAARLPPASLPPELVALRERLARMAATSPDAELAAAFAQAPEIIQGAFTYPPSDREHFRTREREQAEALEPHLLRELRSRTGPGVFEVPFERLRGWPQHLAQTNLPAFAGKARHIGHLNAFIDPDGILRRFPLLAKLEGARGLLPSVELATAAVYLGARIEPVYDPDQERLVGVRLRREGKTSLFVPFQLQEPFTLVNHVGSSKVFPQLSLGDVLDGTFRPEEVRGKAVLMGVNLVGLIDQRATPFRENEAGIFSHASMLSNILSGDYLRRPVEARLLELSFILLAALALARLLPRLRFTFKLLLMVVLAGAWVIAAHLMFERGVQLATILPAATVLVCSFATIFLGYLSVDREKGMLRSAFQHYLNESVMEQMLAHPERLKLGGEKKEMTVLFLDIRGFTSLSERMAPEALVKFINSYLTPMTRIVFEEGGTLDKYIGDALMAFWGAPIDQADHAVRACRAAVRFQEKLEELKVAWRDQDLPEFDIGVGINSGPMIVGNMGSDIRFDYTVMGDAVNLASRLEGTNKEYETRILISEATYLLVREAVIARRLGAVRVKGKREPVGIYELRGMGQAQGKEAEGIQTFEAALEAYMTQRFEEAGQGFRRILELWGEDAPSRRYLEEIAVLKVRPPGPSWDGVYTATTK